MRKSEHTMPLENWTWITALEVYIKLHILATANVGEFIIP